MPDEHDTDVVYLAKVLSENIDLHEENARLRQRLLTAAGDDLCRLTQEEIKGMSAGTVQIPPKEEFLASCERFHAQVAGESGTMPNCLTLAQLVAECERLRALVESGYREGWYARDSMYAHWSFQQNWDISDTKKQLEAKP